MPLISWMQTPPPPSTMSLDTSYPVATAFLPSPPRPIAEAALKTKLQALDALSPSDPVVWGLQSPDDYNHHTIVLD